MVDLHTHLLPGLDDGCDRCRRLCRDGAVVGARDGVTVVRGTPHVRDDYPTTAEAMGACARRCSQRGSRRSIAALDEARGR